MTNAQAWGSRIKWHRLDRSMTQRDLAEAVGVTQTSVSKWELGAAVPTMDLAIAIARALGTTLDPIYFTEITDE